MIATHLISNFDNKISSYFSSHDWKGVYDEKIKQIYHDEPWLTLVACYSIFGDQTNIVPSQLNAFNDLMNSSGMGMRFNFTSIDTVKVEEKLHEIVAYRRNFNEQGKKGIFHFYPDRIEAIKKKLKNPNSSFEGNTNLDLLIEGISDDKKVTLFIEAKFLSDISYQITYNPVRDQIIRNIDAGIDYVLDERNDLNFENFYFLLLTPEVFRTKKYGGSKENEGMRIGANSSRLYCYKMDEYKDPEMLMKNLPHRKLSDENWQTIAKNIGWITFEDFRRFSCSHATFDNKKEEHLILQYFSERNIY